MTIAGLLKRPLYKSVSSADRLSEISELGRQAIAGLGKWLGRFRR